MARRIFFSVLACALLPISTFALISLHEVTDRLEHDAQVRLDEDAKQLAMNVLERLLLLDGTLRLFHDALGDGTPAARVADLPLSLRTLAEGRFRSFAVGRDAADDPLLAAFTNETEADRLHLEAGGSWLRVVQMGAETRILLAHLAGAGPSARLVVAEVDPRFLFAREALRPHVELDRRSATRVRRCSTPARAESRSATRLQPRPTPPAAGEPTLQGSWDLFLRPALRTATWRFVLREPETVVLAPIHEFRIAFLMVALLSLLGVSLASLVLIRRQLVPIETLHAATRRLAERDFDTRVEITSKDEFQDLARSFNDMAESVSHQIRVMETVNAVGSALSVEPDRARLLEVILSGAMIATSAQAGALHLVDASGRLERMLLHAGSAAEETELAHRLDGLAAQAAASGAVLEDRGSGILSIPMQNHEGEVIGVLQLRASHGADGFSREARELSESLASQTAVALTRDRLAGEFRGLFEGLIQLIVTAIDEKSPYTGAHCRRVPILTELIADAACGVSYGPLKEFSLSELERYELRIAALLHDCGKVTTPVHVQDKATKLQTLFDRIEVVDLRFEIAKRELEFARLRDGDAETLASSLIELEDDRAFLRRCNTGGEFMDQALQERVRQIAGRWRWRGPDGAERPILDDADVENLTIARGTLNTEEREIMNQHVVTTIQMLEQLPYPRALRNVPFIAGCHHERMDGCGYPNHLTREQMSLQARILGLADVFEALTAKDRPYKPAMRVKTALRILDRMKEEGHIDPDLFEVFMREKVYLQYAAKWLDPEQIDEELVEEVVALSLREGDVRRDA